jgi:hypothetical protein
MINKRYLNRKGLYPYHYVALPIPRRLQELLKPFFGRDLEITIDARPEKVTIVLTPKPDKSQKQFLARETSPIKQEEISMEYPPSNEPQQNLLKHTRALALFKVSWGTLSAR